MAAITLEEMVRKINDKLEKLGENRAEDHTALEVLGTRMGSVEDALKKYGEARTIKLKIGDPRVWLIIAASLFGGGGLGILGAKAEAPATAETIHQIERLEHAVSDLTEKIEAIPVASTRAN